MIVNINGKAFITTCPALPAIETRNPLKWLRDIQLPTLDLNGIKDLFQVVRDPMVTLQICPDRTVFTGNKHGLDDLGRALHELYVLPQKRFQFRKWRITYRPQENITFDITFEKDSIRFWLTVPGLWESYAKTKLQTVWPKATVKSGEIPAVDPQKATCSVLSLKNHNLYSLAVSKNDLKPLNSLLEVSKDIQEGDLARIQVVAVPRDRQVWEYEAQRVAKKHRMGEVLMRNDVSAGNFFDILLRLMDKAFSEVFETLGGVTSHDGKVKLDKNPDNILAVLLEKNNRELKEATIQKINAPVFGGMIRIAAQSDDEKRAKFLVKSIANAYGDLTAENEFKRRDLKGKSASREIDQINAHKVPINRLSYSVFSHAELGKLLQIPGAELQDEFKAIDQVPLRESNLPESVTKGGIEIGSAKFHGKEIPVYIPTDNIERLCLPRVVIGGMGTSKTTGFAVNVALGIYLKGGTAIVMDPGKGQVYDELSKVVPAEHLKRYQIGTDIISLDWRESLHSERGRNRFANALVGYIDAASDEAGAQTVRYCRAAAKAIPNGKLDEIIQLFLDKGYRKSLIPQMRPHEQVLWKNFDTLGDGRQNQISMPVLNRLDIITGDDYLMECLEDPNAIGIDFVKEFDTPGQIVIIDMPLQELGTEVVDIVGSLITSKIQLAVSLRKKEHPVFVIQDEPHQYMRGYKTWKNLAVISRKYRVSFNWLFHSWEQIPKDLAVIIKSALPHYHIYTSSQETYKALAKEIAPFTIEEGLATPFFWAINVIRDSSGTVAPFLAHMISPPSMNK